MKIKVVSLNLWHGGRLFPAILDFLKKEDPDILLCQEVYNGTDPSLVDNLRTVDVIQQHLHFAAAEFVPSFFDADKGVDSGNAVFARFPVAKRSNVFLAGAYRELDGATRQDFAAIPRLLQQVTLNTPAGELNVFNLHGVWDLDGDNYSPQRQAMSKLTLEATAGKTNVILAGDSNAKPTNKAMLAIEKQLVSVFGNELPSSFNMRHKDNPGYATATVDVMYVSDTLRVIDKACPDVDVSDHLPLVVTLEIPETNE